MALRTSLLAGLPDILFHARQQAGYILFELEARHRPPARPLCALSRTAPAAHPSSLRVLKGNPLALTLELLTGDVRSPGLLGRVKLICWDPPLDGNWPWRRDGTPHTRPDPATGTRNETSTARLGSVALRLYLCRALLAPDGIFCVRLAPAALRQAQLLLDAVFGSENRLGTPPGTQPTTQGPFPPDRVLLYATNPGWPDTGAPATAPPDWLQHLLHNGTRTGDTIVAIHPGADIARLTNTHARHWVLLNGSAAVG